MKKTNVPSFFFFFFQNRIHAMTKNVVFFIPSDGGCAIIEKQALRKIHDLKSSSLHLANKATSSIIDSRGAKVFCGRKPLFTRRTGSKSS